MNDGSTDADTKLTLPADLTAELGGYEWERDDAGESGAIVVRLHGRRGAPDLYLKHGGGTLTEDLLAEADRLRWLAGRLPVPAVVQFRHAADEAWLLTEALPGETACELLEAGTDADAQTRVVEAMGRFLRTVHSIPVQECPFDSGHVGRLAHARRRIDAGLVDEDDFDGEREGWTAEQVWQALQEAEPFSSDLVVTHGDFSLDNVLIANGRVVGCIDVGRLGVADRYQDLAIAWNCLEEFGPALQAQFLAAYGVTKIDRGKLHFYRMLDELF
ncbi:APH(3') family aminoglycoside O-phosphotransferase [Sphingomonas sp. Y38-1Y]|uniref:APH(3') family aminoglycoside O-phosphotransferase n=1 Tax=Sphingomonas sp. Y38-1Y TaxID=3078265 RepID=UPI0028E5EB56|nr:APH(3') family aminoglycoside O-phosphotransferase [Sphingomonas sp. Y38-1Y]